MILTKQMFEAGKSDRGGYKVAQLKALGLKWEGTTWPDAGWPRRLIGSEITEKQYAEFMELRGRNVPQETSCLPFTGSIPGAENTPHDFCPKVAEVMAQMSNPERAGFAEWVMNEHYRLARIENARNKSAESFANELYDKNDRNLA